MNKHEEPTMSAESIPDVDKLSKRVLDFIKFMDDNIEMEKKNNLMYYNQINLNFPDVPRSIIKLLEDRNKRKENLRSLVLLLERMKKIKAGEVTIEDEYKKFVGEMNKKYIFDPHGGEENFNRIMMENAAKKGR